MRRDEILQASARIFRRKGYHATSMQDIAEAVQLQKPSLYHHIASKQEILLALLDQALDYLIEELERVTRGQNTAESKLRKAVTTYIRRLTENADLAAVLLLEYRSLEPGLLSRHIQKRDAFESIWRQIILDGVQSGEFRRVDPKLVGFALLGVQNWVITWFDHEGPLHPKEVADGFVDLLLEGLKKDEAPP
jgi:AcrR family transcriptional regulator